jgi:hypothetical protein
MASANTSYTDLITSTLEFRAPDMADNVTGNNAVTAWIKANGGYKITGGGSKILEPLAANANTNGGWYSGYDQLPVGSQEEFSAAEYPWKQLAVPIVCSGLETDVQNTGNAAVFDLLEERIKNAERTASNLVTTGIFSDGSGTAGKQLTGLLALLPATPTTGTYGGINRATATNVFWRPKYTDTGAHASATTIVGFFNTMFNSLIRGTDKPDLIVTDATNYAFLETAYQALQRFTSPKAAELGFEALKFKTADVVLDGTSTTDSAFFLNTQYLKLRVSKNRNFKALPAQHAFNQDAQVVILAAALNLCCSNSILQGRLQMDD